MGTVNLTNRFLGNKCATGLGSAAFGIDYASLPADNGVPTLTFALLAGSQAIDAGDNSVIACAQPLRSPASISAGRRVPRTAPQLVISPVGDIVRPTLLTLLY